MTQLEKFRRAAQKSIDFESLTQKEFLSLAKLGIEAARKFPGDRRDIAYLLVSAGACTQGISRDPSLQEIADRLASLELPDAHIDTRNASVDGQWQAVTALINDAYTRVE